jgi:hypothetical protein
MVHLDKVLACNLRKTSSSLKDRNYMSMLNYFSAAFK